MNDIDRSVDSFDFAMRRRFRFVELKADEHLEAINETIEDEERRSEAIRRMTALNKEIAEVEDLNENYQIGAAYFAKLRTIDFDQLWTDYLRRSCREYIQGMYDEGRDYDRFARAYGYKKPARGDANELLDQGKLQQKKDAFSQVARLTGKIADKTLEQLEREGVFVFPETVKDAEDITQDQMILQSVNDTYRSGNVMGFLGYGDERLVIESRFCGEGEDYFFQYLLDKVLDFPNIVDLMQTPIKTIGCSIFCCFCFRITSK